MDDAQKAARERRMADFFAQQLPKDQREYWHSCRYTGRFHLDQHTEMLVMTHQAQGVVETGRWAFDNVKIDFDHGLELQVVSRCGLFQDISHYPKLLGSEPIFVWIPPYCSDARYLQHSTGFGLSLNIAFRCMHAPTDRKSVV